MAFPSPNASFLSEQYSAERADAAVPRLRRPLPRTAQEPLEAILAQHLRHLHEGPADAALRQDAARHYRPCAGLGMVRRGERRQARRGQPRLRDTARKWGELDEHVPYACANIARNPRRPVARFLDRRRGEHPWPVAALRLLTLTGARRVPRSTGCPASVNSGAQTSCAVPVHTSKVITLPMEWVITLLWNPQLPPATLPPVSLTHCDSALFRNRPVEGRCEQKLAFVGTHTRRIAEGLK